MKLYYSAENGFNLINYLKKENKGTEEFRISFQNEKHFIVHPMNRDGKTIDIKLK